ncbi:MAG: ketoacyl-ACP synthase III [Nocardiaceae bacterium]|nr:ketoacyl-ACP synthase III [Nocardiaceae bacterium]
MPASIGSPTGISHVAMMGIGAYRPVRVVPNSEIVEAIDSSDEWIQTRSGIRSRRFAGEDETVITMATAASEQAIRSAGIDAAQIDCVINATSTNFQQTPPAAPQIASALGITGTAAFDLGAGCSGFCYALQVAADMIRGGSARHVLVIGAEKLSPTVNPRDRGTAFIFGDGAGAVIVGPSDEEGIGPVTWGSDGELGRAIGQTKNTLDYINEVEANELTGQKTERPYLAMEGTMVFRWAASTLEKALRDAVDKAGLSMQDIEALIPHQANGRITDVMAKHLKLSENCAIARDIEETGNTSAASIPLAMEQLLSSGAAKPGATALLLAFGAGLTWAGQVVKLPKIVA